MSRHHTHLNPRRWAAVRRAVLERDGYRCRACGRASRLEVDHIVPLQWGGDPYDLDNLQALCAFPCHREKTISENLNPDRLTWNDYVRELMSKEMRNNPTSS